MKRELTEDETMADAKTAGVIDAFHLKMVSVSSLATSQLPHAQENQQRERKALHHELADVINQLENSKNVRDQAHALNAIQDITRKSRILSISHEEMLSRIIFIFIFSVFDAYLKDLLRELYSRSPKLLLGLEHRQLTLKDILQCSQNEIITSVIEIHLDGLLRESYPEVFKRLATDFKLTTLTKFDSWKRFIEHSQRRNLLTHCDGIVNSEYLKKCGDAGCLIPSDVVVGFKLDVSYEYLKEAINVVTEVGLKIGQVLWRASCGGVSIWSADCHLGNLMFECLKLENWSLTLRLGELGRELEAREKELPFREEKILRIITLNHAQAAKWSGDANSSRKLLDSVDWSGSINEFQLAVAVLREEYDEAAALMRKIGRESDLCPIHGYTGWPIFREFRVTPQFSAAFESIYGVAFEVEVRRQASEGEFSQTVSE